MRYYYKDNKGNLFNFKTEHFVKYKKVTETTTLTDENGKPVTETVTKTVRDGLEDGYTQITEEKFKELSNKRYEPTEEQKAKIELSKTIREKKELLNKYREDVEQVDLFGMERADYAEKKELCKQLVYELREMEALLKTQ